MAGNIMQNGKSYTADKIVNVIQKYVWPNNKELNYNDIKFDSSYTGATNIHDGINNLGNTKTLMYYIGGSTDITTAIDPIKAIINKAGVCNTFMQMVNNMDDNIILKLFVKGTFNFNTSLNENIPGNPENGYVLTIEKFTDNNAALEVIQGSAMYKLFYQGEESVNKSEWLEVK